MKNVLTILTAISLSSLLLVSCSTNGPTSPIVGENDLSITLESQQSGNITKTIVGGQVTTQSISPTEQIGTATIVVENKNGKTETLYVKIHGTISSQIPGMPVILSHAMEVYKNPGHTQLIGKLQSEGDIGITTGFEFPLVSIYETVNIVSGTKNYKRVSSESSIVVTGTLNLVTDQNQFDVIGGKLTY